MDESAARTARPALRVLHRAPLHLLTRYATSDTLEPARDGAARTARVAPPASGVNLSASNPPARSANSVELLALTRQGLAGFLVDDLQLAYCGEVGVAHRGDDLDVLVDAGQSVVIRMMGRPADCLLLELHP